MSVSVSARYTSVACSRSPHAVDWNTNGVICYAASNVVALYDTNIHGADPITILSHHRSRVNFVKWIQSGAQHPTELISCSGDKTAVLWSRRGDRWTPSAVLEGHADGVTCADALYPIEGELDSLLVYTGSIDCTIRVWERKEGVVKCRQTISLGSGLCLTLRATFFPNSRDPLLLCALDDDKIYLFSEFQDQKNEYHKASVLVGHEDWVRGLDVITLNGDSLLVASCSQDTYVRLWSVGSVARCERAAGERAAGGVRVEAEPFSACGRAWCARAEAVLAGHEGWVYGVHWHPPLINAEDGTVEPVYRLLSSSLDKSAIVWEPEGGAAGAGAGVWAERVRVGEVGGNGLGFYGSKFGPRGKSFVAHGYCGSFHMWKLNEETDKWEPSVVCGGHFGEAVDVRWEPGSGRYLASAAADQTTRVHAPWARGGAVEWHEVARPQVHGFDMASLALVPGAALVSAAEEKVVRVFRPPHNFVQNFRSITKMELAPDGAPDGPEGASVPSLGLSNKAVYTGDESQEDGDDSDRYFVPVNLTEPPTEESLMQNTLWPEVQKLYGHGYEVHALAACPRGAFVASACRAATPEHAAILLWDTKEWRQVGKLSSHQLTVTQLAFSPDGARLLSVSRDRRWSLFRRAGDTFELEAASDKASGVHARIVWCCAWAHDSTCFATGSRDGKVCVWGDVGNTKESPVGPYGLVAPPLEFADASVTALAFGPISVAESKILAVGFESGLIKIYLLTATKWTLALELDNSRAHHLTVKRLEFRPVAGEAGAEGATPAPASTPVSTPAPVTLQLASCGSDHLVRIYNLYVDK